MRIALVSLQRDAERVPPVGLVYLATYLNEKAGIKKDDIKILEPNYCDVEKELDDFKPDLIGFSAMTVDYGKVIEFAKRIKPKHNVPFIIGGAHISSLPESLDEIFDVGVIGEGEITLAELAKAWTEGIEYYCLIKLRKINGLVFYNGDILEYTPPRMPIPNLDDLPIPNFKFISPNYFNKEEIPSISDVGVKGWMMTSRGCPYRCLTGDTLINTIEGMIPIKELTKRKKIGVYTYDSKTKEVFITNAINIRKTGKQQDIVRVSFDDGTHIDCTMNHMFLTFKNGNQFGLAEEKIKAARELKPKESVRAIKLYLSGKGYKTISWGRRNRKTEHVLIMEYILNRKLSNDECIHHIDKNILNNNPRNLILCKDAEEHFKYHPEIADRMKKDNPQRYCTEESFEKIRKAITGLKRTHEQKQKYRLSKLGKLNPNWNPSIDNSEIKKLYLQGNSMQKVADKLGCNRLFILYRLKTMNIKSRPASYRYKKEINHKVISVIPIGKADVYNMEVPSTNWFFANNVLVHNCVFCSTARFWGNMRFHSPEYTAKMAKKMIEDYGVDFLKVMDDLFTVSVDRMKDIKKSFDNVNILARIKAIECQPRANLMTDELCIAMRDLKIKTINFGFESGSQKILQWLKQDSVTVEMNMKAIELGEKYGFNVYGSLMYGSPGETIEDMEKTNDFIDFAKKHKAKYLWSFVSTPFPATPFWDIALQRGKVSNDMDWNLLSHHTETPLLLDDNISKDDFQKVFKEGKTRLRGLKVQMIKDFVLKNPGKAMMMIIKEPRYYISRAWKQVFKQ